MVAVYLEDKLFISTLSLRLVLSIFHYSIRSKNTKLNYASLRLATPSILDAIRINQISVSTFVIILCECKSHGTGRIAYSMLSRAHPHLDASSTEKQKNHNYSKHNLFNCTN